MLFVATAFRGVAQPGPWGGSLRFRLFDPKSQLIAPERTDYYCFPSWRVSEKESLAHRGTLHNFAATFQQEDCNGYRMYAAMPTPAGGIVPPDFTLNVVHGRDTMRVHGLTDFGRYTLRLDSIPFKPGTYWVPAAYVPLLNVQAVGGRIENNGWDFFRSPAARPDRLTTERLVPHTEASNTPDSAVSDPQLTVQSVESIRRGHEFEPGRSSVYLANGRRQRPKLLLRHLTGRPQAVAGVGDRLLVLVTERIVLKSENGGITWRVYEVHDAIAVPRHGHVAKLEELNINKIWTEGDQVLAHGSRYSGEGGSWRSKQPSLYKLHFIQDSTSALIQRNYARGQADYLAALTRHEQQRKNEFMQRVRIDYRKAENQSLVRQGLLRHSWFAQNDSYILPATNWKSGINDGRPAGMMYHLERPIVVLHSSQFSYVGTNWVTTPTTQGEHLPQFVESGSYTVTDSTITFQAQPADRFTPAAPAAGFNYYPAGTYYYHYMNVFNTILIILERWDEKSGGPTHYAFRLRQSPQNANSHPAPAR